MTRKVFSNKVVKTLRIPTFIFYYNLYIGGVTDALSTMLRLLGRELEEAS